MPQYFFEGIQVFLEGRAPSVCNFIAGMGFAIDERFGNRYIFFFLESLDVRSKVTVGYIELLFETAEIIVRIGDQYRHDLQPDAMFQHFVQVLEGAFHLVVFVVHNGPVYYMQYTEP